ncbi:MAG: chorismate synthase [Bacteroidales bacterium]
MNTFGTILKFTSFGESHGKGIGGVIDGFPSNIYIDLDFIQNELNKRKPGIPNIGSGRKEEDKIEILSGIYQGYSLGSPIAFFIANTDANAKDYEDLKSFYRPSHADDTYKAKYGIRDARGGGRASGRETAIRVAVGAFAKILLKKYSIEIYAYTDQIGKLRIQCPYTELELNHIYDHPLRCPETQTEIQMENLLKECRQKKDSIGGAIFGLIRHVPKGLGEPLYDKLPSRLASAMLGINAVRGFEIGMGFDACTMKGSEHNDIWTIDGKTEKNLCGGVRGGISTGEDIYFRVAFKPIASIGIPQLLLSENQKIEEKSIQGRHDVCCVPRAVPVVEAMSAICIADFLLIQQVPYSKN